MFAQLRNKRIAIFSTLLIIFALSAKMLVPIAHASGASANTKSFLATLCIGNKIVSVALDLSGNQQTTPESNISSANCPLCFITEHDSPNQVVVEVAANPQQSIVIHTPYQALFSTSANNAFPIRAPPVAA